MRGFPVIVLDHSMMPRYIARLPVLRCPAMEMF
jgi:hypothetical protein